MCLINAFIITYVLVILHGCDKNKLKEQLKGGKLILDDNFRGFCL